MCPAECIRIMGVTDSAYYHWKASQEEREKRQKEKDLKDDEDAQKFMAIVKYLNHVPGRRNFKLYLWLMFGIVMSESHCSRIMKKYRLEAALPKKDIYKEAYRHVGVYDHECLEKGNLVDRKFKVGPRDIILTDITYLYFGADRSLYYLCTFIDAYTTEVLGYAMSRKIDALLVKAAYEDLKKKHALEICTADCVIHSDQGSVYKSTTFEKLLSDDSLLHSMSAVGCGYDNAPQESFFGRMKTHVLDRIARCPDYDTAVKMTANYIHDHNTKHVQPRLAFLAPSDFYVYATTGYYRLNEAFGIKEEELIGSAQFQIIHDEMRAKQAERRKERDERRKLLKAAEKGPRLDGSALSRVIRDGELCKDLIHRAEKELSGLKSGKEKCEKVLEKIQDAVTFMEGLSAEELEKLKYTEEWKKHEELEYIRFMRGFFKKKDLKYDHYKVVRSA